jgi:hypothetical protein
LKTAPARDSALIIISIQPNPPGLSSNQILNYAGSALTQTNQDYNEVSRKKTVLDGKEAIIIEYTGHRSPTVYLFHDLYLVLPSHDATLLLNCTSADEMWNKYADDYNNIVRSIRFTY